jgi:type IV secretion system protein VirB10
MKRSLALIALLIVSTCSAQEPLVNTSPSLSQEPPQSTAPAAAQDQTIVIPAGTRIPLSLASPLTNKTAKPGTAVRAVTGFPVTVGRQVAIPAGTYVEGVIDKVTKASGSSSGLQMHFTRILFANGYSVPADGVNIQANAIRPDSVSPQSATYLAAGLNFSTRQFAIALAEPQVQTLPPLPKGPNIGLIAGIVTGVTATIIILGLVLRRHAGGGDAVLFDTGWQFDMVLQSPVTLSATSIAGAIAPAGAQ